MDVEVDQGFLVGDFEGLALVDCSSLRSVGMVPKSESAVHMSVGHYTNA